MVLFEYYVNSYNKFCGTDFGVVSGPIFMRYGSFERFCIVDMYSLIFFPYFHDNNKKIKIEIPTI